MKKRIRLSAIVAVTVCCLWLTAFFAVPIAAESETLTLECEEAAYTATLSNGSAWAPKNASADMTKENGAATKGIVFTDGDVGAKISYTVTVAEAGEYELSFACRPNENYYADLRVFVNETQIGSTVTLKSGETVLGQGNVDNRVRDMSLGNAALSAGDNTVTFEVVTSAKAPKSITVALDAIILKDPDSAVQEKKLTFEAENMPFTATDSQGQVISQSGEKGTWAWTLNLANTYGVSGKIVYFRSGGLGGTVDFKATVEKGGQYGLVIAFRPNGGSYSTVDILVNGKKIGGSVSQKTGVMVGGVLNNASDTVRELVMGNVELAAGENTFTVKMVGQGATLETSAFTLDYFRLVDPVDESKLTFSEPEPDYPKVADKDNSTPVTVALPNGMLDSYPGISETPKTTDKITVYPMPDCYQASDQYTVTVDGVTLPVYTVSAGSQYRSADYCYVAFDYDPAKGPVTVKIEAKTPIVTAKVSPEHLKTTYKKSGKTLTLTIDRNQNYAVAINSSYLVIAADPMETDKPASSGEGIFNITASPYCVDPKTMTDKAVTEAIQKALDDASAYGSLSGHQNGVVYIPAGVYSVGNLVISSNTYLYLEGGAVLRITDDTSLLKVRAVKTSMKDPNGKSGLDFTWWLSTAFSETITADPETGKAVVDVKGSYDIRIGGRGTIDGRDAHFWNTAEEGNHTVGANTVVPIGCSHFTMEGIVIRDAVCWSVVAVRSNDLVFDNLKLLNVTTRHHDENDGIDICECQNVTVKNSIGFAMDDPFSIKTWPYRVGITVNWPGYPEYSSKVTFDNCVAYTHRMGFKVGQGTDQCHYDLTFRNCTVVDATMGFGLHASSGAGTVYNLVFDNIYVEKVHNGGFYGSGACWLYLHVQANSRGNGNVMGVTVKNIHVSRLGTGNDKIYLAAIGTNNTLYGVTFSNIEFDGVRAETLDDLKPRLEQNDFVYEVVMENSDLLPIDPPTSSDTATTTDAPTSTGTPDSQVPTTGDDPGEGEPSEGLTWLWITLAGVIFVAGGGVIAFILIRKKKR